MCVKVQDNLLDMFQLIDRDTMKMQEGQAPSKP
jgi:hypothetical protein